MNADLSPKPYSADRSLWGKLRRRVSKLIHTKPAYIRGQKRPLLTLSFDDAPVSSLDNGAAILNRYGLKGTWFISSGLMGQDSHMGRFLHADEVKTLAAQGHEIACHTYEHLDCGKASAQAIETALSANQAAFADNGFPIASTFAYPYGDVSAQAKKVLKSRFLAARALHHGLIRSGTDLNQAPCIGIEGDCGEMTALDWLKVAKTQPDSWLCLNTHDVRETPSAYGCTPRALEHIIVTALEAGFEIVTFSQGALRARRPYLAVETA